MNLSCFISKFSVLGEAVFNNYENNYRVRSKTHRKLRELNMPYFDLMLTDLGKAIMTPSYVWCPRDLFLSLSAGIRYLSTSRGFLIKEIWEWTIWDSSTLYYVHDCLMVYVCVCVCAHARVCMCLCVMDFTNAML